MPKLAENTIVISRKPGRPRSEKARKAVLESTLELLKRYGFHDLSIEAVAASAGVGKATVYRWWSNKAELVIAAFISVVEEQLRFPPSGSFEKAIHEQMRSWVLVYRSPLGQVIATIIGAGQSEPEMIEAFRTHWVEPRRVEARVLLSKAVEEKQIRSDIDPDTVIDLFYGPLYLRLLVTHDPLTTAFVDVVFDTVIRGLRP